MTTLFSATQMPSSSQGSFGSISMDVVDGKQLRATQNPQFSMTQSDGATEASVQSYDWLSPTNAVSW